MKNWLYGRNVIVTGCSTGMGRDVTRLLVKKYGCYVLGVARQKPKLDELKEELGDRFTYRRFDIGSKEAWENFIADFTAMGFKPDVIINNAGMIQPFSQFSDLDDEKVRRVLTTNLESVVWGCKAMIPIIKESKFGGIVNVASASALLPVAGEGIYSATKCGVRGLTETLFQELRGYGVFVSCIMPGPVKTDIYKAREGEEAKVKDNLIERVGITSEVAAKRIIRAIKKRKPRVSLDGIAKLMDFAMRVVPRTAMKVTAWAMKFATKFVASFVPVFNEQKTREAELKKRKKERKKEIYSSAEAVPASDVFKNDMPQ